RSARPTAAVTICARVSPGLGPRAGRCRPVRPHSRSRLRTSRVSPTGPGSAETLDEVFLALTGRSGGEQRESAEHLEAAV
ncbi:hypothetical protein AN219_02520, partial [Streptomyces nanshensis]